MIKYENCLLPKLILKIQRKGNKKKIERKVLHTFRSIKLEQKLKYKVGKVLTKTLSVTKPYVGTRYKKVGSVTYSIPVSITPHKELSVGLFWIVSESCGRKLGSLESNIKNELMLCLSGKGKSIQRKEIFYQFITKNRAYLNLLYRFR